MARLPTDELPAAIRDARVYFVCDAGDGDRGELLRAALRGGVDVLQLRDKNLGDEALVAASTVFREAADELGVPFLINDRPDLVAACEADGVHVGQEDAAVGRAREVAGAGAVVGLSTHSPAQLEAACALDGAGKPDYVSVGPVWATPTKPGRAAAGLEYVRHAAASASMPWFAIGGIDEANLDEVLDAGATRIVVVRAIRDAEDPESAAASLCSRMDVRERQSPLVKAATQRASEFGAG
ncbi:MAG: thiamine phosphate synthase [Solirubrobacterales bacterium]